MTDTQQINASVLAEYLDVVKQLQESLKEYTELQTLTRKYGETESTTERIAYRIFDRIKTYQILEDLDALRALVAEQEREEPQQLFQDDGYACCDGGTQDRPCACNGARLYTPIEQAEPRADISNCKTIADVSEAVNAFATQQFQQMATPVYTDHALRVGDKVRGIDEDGAREMTIVSRVDNFYWEVDDGGWWRDSDLTLIERAQQ